MVAAAALALVAVLGYGVAAATLWTTQRRKLFRPPPWPGPSPAAAGVPQMAPRTTHTADGLALLNWYAPPRAGRPVVVMCHRNNGSLSIIAVKAAHLLAAGYGVWLVGYRGYSGNPGTPCEQGLYRDGRAVLDHLAADGVPAARIVLYGESLGSGVAVQLATEATVAGLILEAAYTSIPDIAAGLYPWLPVRLLARDRFDNLAKISHVTAPVLVLHGARDPLVPFRCGQALATAARAPVTAAWLPNGAHNNLYDHGAPAAVLEFLERLG